MPAYFLAPASFHATRHFLSDTGASGRILLPAQSQASFPPPPSPAAGPFKAQAENVALGLRKTNKITATVSGAAGRARHADYHGNSRGGAITYGVE